MLDAHKMREIEAVAPTLEIEDSNWPGYEKLVILRALEFFQKLQEAGGLERLIDIIERTETESQSPRDAEPSRRTVSGGTVETYCDSDFLLAVSGKDSAEAWAVMDELMDALRSVNIKAYNKVMAKIKGL